MKAIRFLAITLISALAFTGCSKDNNELSPPTPNGGDIVFNIGFAPQTYVATDAQFKSTWENGDAIGIYAVKRASGATGTLAASGNYMQNVKLSYNGTNWTTDGGVIHYFPNDGEVLDFYAYYPYDATATDPLGITFNVETDQSTAANYNVSDLLSAKQAGVAKGTTVDLTFAHKLALVQVEVDLGTIKGSGPTETLAITLRGCKAGGKFNLGDGILTTAGKTQAVNMLRVETDPATATTYTYRALVPAQSVPIGTNLCLMAQNGQLFSTPTLAAALDLTASAAKRYTAKLPASAIQTVKILKGTFLMGSSDGTGNNGMNPSPAEPNRRNNETQHKVTLTKDFYMSKYTITNAQYAAFLNANAIGNDGKWSSGPNPSEQLISASSGSYDWGLHYNTDKWEPVSDFESHPVIYVSWYGSVAYCEWLSSVTGGSWRLPTESEWEYACRGGKANHPFGIGTGYALNNTNANFNWEYSWSWDGTSATATISSTSTSPSKTQPVGSYIANNYGLYDMHGNVLEWCSDWYGGYSNTPATDPTGPNAGYYRVLRGGGWSFHAQNCRSAYRYYFNSELRDGNVGFRVVFVP